METAHKDMRSTIQQLPKRGRWDMLSLEEALACLDRMLHPPTLENLTTILGRCRKHKNPAYALRLHAYLRKSGLETHSSVGNYLVPILVEVGSMGDAQQVFDRLHDRNEYSWTSLITGYIQCGQFQDAFVLYQNMQEEDSVHPNGYTFVALLKAAARLKDTQRGQELHAEIIRKGLLERDPFVGNTLVDMYSKCGLLEKACEVFDKLPVRDAVSWNALIAGYAEHGLCQDALNCFEQMQLEGISPNSVTFLCSLKACASIAAIDKGREIHAHIATKGLLERELFVGSTLVDMYVKCGLLAKAQEVFDKLPVQLTVSWNALIAGYTEHGLGQHTLNCFKQMQLEGVSPDAVTFVCSFKACGSIGAIDKGREIHAQIAEKGLVARDPFVGNTLVDMYAKCGLLAKAQEVFDKLPVRDAVSWTALIAGYAEHGLGQDTLNCFEQMQLEGVSPNSVTFVCSLKACGSTGTIDKAQEIHAQIAQKGLLERDFVVGNTLLDMYAKCGLLAKAQEVFDKLTVRDAVSWNALIAGYAEHGLGQDALTCFKQMQLEGISPDVITFVCNLKACGSIGAIEKGQEIHSQIVKMGLLERDPFLGNTLVDMYAKCHFLAKAQEVFDKLPVRDAVTWTAIIAGYAEHGLGEDALICFEQMQLEGVSPHAVTFVCSLKACGSIGAIDKGQEIHAQISKEGLLERDPFVGNTLVDVYAKCGLLKNAQEVFDELPVQDAVSWNALISGYAEHGLDQKALTCFEQMQLEGVSPDAITLVCSLKACGSMGAMYKGQEIHAQIFERGLLERDPLICSTLVDMYFKCGLLAKPQEVFDKLQVRDSVLWSALMAGYAERGHGQEALNCFAQMQLEGVSPNSCTFVCSLKACGNIGAIDEGREIHAQVAANGLLERDPFIGSTLVDMYAKCGLLAKAQEVFDKLPIRDAVLWTALIAGYAEHGLGQDALHCFEQMQLEGVSPDVVTFVCSLKACGRIGAIYTGQEIHAQVATKGLLETNPFIGSIMVDMYAKCGWLEKAQEVFDKLPVRDAVSWTALISGYAHVGHSENVFLTLDRMRAEDLKPDGVIFLSILTVCSHTGLVEMGQTYFEAMSKEYSITPTVEHLTCMVDLLGRAGQLDKAAVMIKKMPFNPNLVLWLTVLGACRKWGNVELGRWAFEHAVQMDEKDAAAYVLMSNIYADAHMQEDARHVEIMRLKEQSWKTPGQRWSTDVGGIVFPSLIGDTGHLQSIYIYAKLEDVLLKMLEEVSVRWVSQNRCNDLKVCGLSGHSERLAIVTVLNNTPSTHRCKGLLFDYSIYIQIGAANFKVLLSELLTVFMFSRRESVLVGIISVE